MTTERQNPVYYYIDTNDAQYLLSKTQFGKSMGPSQTRALADILQRLSDYFSLINDKYSLIGSLRDNNGNYSGLYAGRINSDTAEKLKNSELINETDRYLFSKARQLIKMIRLGRGKRVMRAAREVAYSFDPSYKTARRKFVASAMTPKQIAKRSKEMSRKYGKATSVSDFQAILNKTMLEALEKRKKNVDKYAKKIAQAIVEKNNLIKTRTSKEEARTILNNIKSSQKDEYSGLFNYGGRQGTFKQASRKGMTLEMVLQGDTDVSEAPIKRNGKKTKYDGDGIRIGPPPPGVNTPPPNTGGGDGGGGDDEKNAMEKEDPI